ncbi:MAG: hypothetical protein KME23_09460 [Goleter apudmare HA4340-LM2]|jgi:hypothetical protein|nr:hypothetical protein [Goleter apudmare HA4340-LM2]
MSRTSVNKFFFIARFTAVSISTLVFLSSASVWGQQQTLENNMCDEPSGRIYSNGDRTWKAGKKICLGEKIEPVDGSTVTVLCFLNRKFVYLNRSTIFDAQVCAPPSNEAVQCSVLNISLCPRSYKGPDDEKNSPIVNSPYGSSIINNRPYISWRSVAEADSYTVVLKGNGVDWETNVENTTSIPYPKGQKELRYGNAYTITVISNRGGKPLNSSQSLVYLLPSNDIQQILAEVNQVKELELSPDEAAFRDLDTIFMSKFLLDETIKILKAQVMAGSQNPTLFRVLGDRYLGALLLEEAKQSYTTAEQLAKKNSNIIELEKIQFGLKSVELLKNK